MVHSVAEVSVTCAQAKESEIEPKPPTPMHARPAGFHQLTQTSSGNLCFAGASTTDAEMQHQLPSNEESPLPVTPAPFQLQPRPTGQQHVDLNALRIMQLQRSISELSTGGGDEASSAAAAAAMTAELHARLCQQNQQHAAQQDGHDDRRHLDGSLHDISADDGCAGVLGEEDSGATAARSHSGTDTEDDTGLYAAAKQAPNDLKAAWSRLMQQPAENKGTSKQGRTGRSSEDRMASPGRLLKCLQSKTASDVEAQMQALCFKH